MRVLLLADIHANWPALQVIREPFDVCVFLGDLVDYGPDPASCVEWVKTNARYAIRGNHDHAVAQRVFTTGKNGFRYLSGVTRTLTWDRLSANQMRYLGSLPVTRFFTVGNARFFLVHATPSDPLDEYLGNDTVGWTQRLERIDADFICVGHTHQPYVLQVGGKTVINPGSVGQPRDGDPRASYAIWEDGTVEIKRVEYDIDEVVRMVEASSLPEQAKRMSIEVYRSGSPYQPNPVTAAPLG
jgi:putative phosphoesterase